MRGAAAACRHLRGQARDGAFSRARKPAMSCCASSLRPWLVSPLSASLRGFQRLSDAHRVHAPRRWAAGPPAGHTAAASGHPRPADPCPGARSAEDPPAPCGRLVDKSAHRDTWGAFIDTWGAEYPGALQTLEGQTSVFSLARLGQVPAGARRGQVMHRNCA